MKKIIILITLYISVYSFLYGQTINSIVIDAKNKHPLNFVSIYNRSTHKFTVTDNSGKFKLNTSKNDTIEFRMLGYQELISESSDLNDTIVLNPRHVELETILLTNGENKKLNDKITTNFQLGLDYMGTYAFKINIPANSIITSVELPIKQRPHFLSDGTINFQIYESDSAKFMLNKPITELISIDDLSVLDEKIVLDFDDFEVKEKLNFYILITRTIPENKMTNSRYFSLNPFLKFDKKGKTDDYYYKFNGTDEWKMSGEFYEKDKPRLSINIYGYQSSD